MKMFPENGDTSADRCRKFIGKYCHPAQIGTGILFGSVGIGLTAAGFLYSDGMNFLFQSAPQIPQQIANGTDLASSIDYVRDSYKESMGNAIQAGWKQLPFSYCVGHYAGGKVRDKFQSIFGRKRYA
ncbi:MAG: hypothetical protein HY833_00440 [Candidatus Aenigmarchaeota archaeon]|nr:hypothetical protein [Candidatus Aenigmarchaeota archaeon]